ncbi:MAG: YqaJ viral recombinase family protein, partial [Candidatus Peribacteraceae bacterium]|nr:YqaJ viral recombinase family protein [Candidatus Peribacteraceae bacterium]
TGGNDFADEDDAAAAFLRGAEGLTVKEERDYHRGGETLTGATAADYQFHRVSSVDYGIQANIKAALEARLDGSRVGFTSLDIDVAVEDFEKITGVSAESFAARIKLPEGQNVSRYPKDLRTAISMLSTAGEKMQAGPGYTLPGNVQSRTKQHEQDAEIQRAFADISAVSEFYMTDITKGSDVYATRKTAIEQSLYGRLLSMPFHEASRSIVPVPHEVNVLGVVPTKGSIGGYTDERGRYQGGGSPYTRLEFANVEGELDPESKMYRALNPSAMHSLMPLSYPKTGTDAERASAYEEMKETRRATFDEQIYGRLQSARATLQKHFPTMSDESRGQYRMAAWQKNMEDYDKTTNLYNLAAEQDADMFRHDDEGIGMPESFIPINPSTGMPEIPEGQTLSGSRKGGMYGEKGLSERDEYVDEQRVLEEYKKKYPIASVEVGADTDRGRYLASVTGKQGVAEQGSAEWLAQRKGLVTGSVSTELGYEMGVETLAANMAAERLGYGSKWRGNAYTARGTRYEESARKSFLATEGKGLAYEEAYFETDPSKPGFGVSPDGRLYNKDGSSAGLLELKVLSDGSMKKAVSDYNRQMQMQMAITGEAQTHFYALNADTGEYLHELVKSDPELQEELLLKGREALDLAAGLDKRGVSEMDKIIKRGGRRKVGSTKPAGQEAKYVPSNGDKEAPMEVFNAMTTVGGKSIRVETGLEDEIEGLGEFMQDFGGFGGDGDGSGTGGDKMKAFERATRDATRALKEFSTSLVADKEEALSTARIAAEVGMDPKATRGLENVLVRGGLSEQSTRANILAAGNQLSKFRQSSTLSKELLRMRYATAVDIPGGEGQLQGMALPSHLEFREMADPRAYMDWAEQTAASLNLNFAERGYFFKEIARLPDQAVFNQTMSGDLGTAWNESYDVKGILGFQEEYRIEKEKYIQYRTETVSGSLGEVAAQTERAMDYTTKAKLVSEATKYAATKWDRISSSFGRMLNPKGYFKDDSYSTFAIPGGAKGLLDIEAIDEAIPSADLDNAVEQGERRINIQNVINVQSSHTINKDGVESTTATDVNGEDFSSEYESVSTGD